MELWPGVVRHWGSTPAERLRPYPCDPLLEDPDDALFRAVDIDARPATVFRWLCQLRVAPYSYDLLDNRGHRSPQQLTPGLERLQPGDRFMTIFRLVEFEADRSITLWHQGGVFGSVGCTYQVVESGPGRSRLLVKLIARYPKPPTGLLARAALPGGDLLMMRRQLLNLKRLAETQASTG
jgi:hypothetical protein